MGIEIKTIPAAAHAWRRTWPKHCTTCGGWGGSQFFQSHGELGREPMFDACEATPAPEVCHRCGEAGLAEDGAGPCKHCGWDYDDGVPVSIVEPSDE